MIDKKTFKEKTLVVSKKEYDKLVETAKAYEILKEMNRNLTLQNKNLIADNLRLKRIADANIEKKRLMIVKRFNNILNEVELIYDREEARKGRDALKEDSDNEVLEIIRTIRSMCPNDELDDNLNYFFSRMKYIDKKMICPLCNKAVTICSEFPVTSLVKFESKAILTDEIFYGFRCRTCDYSLKNLYENVLYKRPVLDNPYVEAETAADIITEKFWQNKSLMMQELNWSDLGLTLSPATMSLWMRSLSENNLSALYELYHKVLLNEKIIFADVYKLYSYDLGRNNITVNESSPLSLWVYRTPGKSDKKLIFFEISQNEDFSDAASFLKNYKGMIHTETIDAFKNGSAEYKVLPLWENVRRLFEEALDAMHPRSHKGSLAKECLGLCDKLTAFEDSFIGTDDDIRLQLRMSKCRPVTDKLFSIAKEFTANGTDPEKIGYTSRAIDFLCLYENELDYYYRYPEVDLDNSWCRNAASELSNEEDNWIIVNTPSGCGMSMKVYSIIKTLQMNDINPERFFTFYLKASSNPQIKTDKNKYLPWKVPPECCELYEI